MLLEVDTAERIGIGARLTYWTAPHPQWKPNPEWPQRVGCVLYVGADAVVLVDPLIRDDLDRSAWEWLDDAIAAANMRVAVLLTAPWHERSARAVVGRYDASVWASLSARGRVDDLPQLGSVPQGITVFAPRGVDEGQVAFVLDDEAALVVGEFFLGTASGLQVLASPATRDVPAFVESLHELERLPIERVLVSHGTPVLSGGSEAISAALRSFPGS